MGSLRSSAPDHDLGHLATECLAPIRNHSPRGDPSALPSTPWKRHTSSAMSSRCVDVVPAPGERDLGRALSAPGESPGSSPNRAIAGGRYPDLSYSAPDRRPAGELGHQLERAQPLAVVVNVRRDH